MTRSIGAGRRCHVNQRCRAPLPLLVQRLITVLMFVTALTAVVSQQAKDKRKIFFDNNAGHRVEIYWVHPQTDERALMSTPDIQHGEIFNLDSFQTHTFEVREVAKKRTGECTIPGKCNSGYVTVNKNSGQMVRIGEGMGVVHEDDETIARDKAAELLTICTKGNVDETQIMGESANTITNSNQFIDDLATCVQKSVSGELLKAAEEIHFQTNIREHLGKSWESYICDDNTLDTTEETEKKYFKEKYPVKVLLDHPASRIHLIENFITDEECRVFEEEAKELLPVATESDFDGKTLQNSDNSKVMQAAITVPWRDRKNAVTQLSTRIFDYANHELNEIHIKEHGQEPPTAIQHFGKGLDATNDEPDQYKSQCDGACEGELYIPGGRIATMVMYCKVPEKGGATNFRNSGVRINPVKGSAVFFSYINPVNRKMDTGFTEHSTCPVIEGEQIIVTQWIRLLDP